MHPSFIASSESDRSNDTVPFCVTDGGDPQVSSGDGTVGGETSTSRVASTGAVAPMVTTYVPAGRLCSRMGAGPPWRQSSSSLAWEQPGSLRPNTGVALPLVVDACTRTSDADDRVKL